MVKKIVIGNLKGGVGKTTNSVLFAYTLASKGFKVLLCDLDPQANSTDLMTKTYKRQNNKDIDLKQTMMQALSEGELKSCMLQIKENLFVLPSSEDFIHYQQYLFSLIPSTIPNYEKKHRAYFGKLLRDFEDEFDYIIFDVPPSASIYLESALYIANHILIILQPHAHSLNGAISFYDHLEDLTNEYPEVVYYIIGVLPAMMDFTSDVDRFIVKRATEFFGEDLIFKLHINLLGRLKRYDYQGIPDISNTTDSDHHDVVLQEFYGYLTDELIERANQLKFKNE